MNSHKNCNHNNIAMSTDLSLIDIIPCLLKSLKDKELVFSLVKKKTEIEHQLYIADFVYGKPENCNSPDWDKVGTEAEQCYIKINSNELINHCIKKREELNQKKKKAKKTKYNILDVLDKAGIKIKGKMILCPFHADRKPSCRIYPETNSFYCFGCGRYGTADDLAEALKEKEE